jgi:ribosomal protein S27AE
MTMVGIKPGRININELPNDPVVRAAAALVIGVGILCGRDLAYCANCRAPVYYSKDHSKRDLVCGQCGSEINWDDFISIIKFCPKCNDEQSASAQYCTRHSPAVILEKREKTN